MIKALLFDLNGTLIDIHTDEWHDDVYRMMSNLLDYQGIYLSPSDLRKVFFDYMKRQLRHSDEKYPEFDVEAIFAKILHKYATVRTKKLSEQKLTLLPNFLAEAYRAATRFRLELYPDVIKTLDTLKKEFIMGAVSDGQSPWVVPELKRVGLKKYFDFIIASGDLGYRKPDPRLYRQALHKLNVRPEEVVFVGNDMYRDVWGAHQAGMKTVFFKSNQGDHRSHGVEADYIIYHFAQLPEALEFLDKE